MRVVIRGVSDEGRSDTKLNIIFIIKKIDYWLAQQKITQLAQKLDDEESKYADKEKALGLFHNNLYSQKSINVNMNHIISYNLYDDRITKKFGTWKTQWQKI